MEKTLPKVNIGDEVKWEDVIPKQHFTKPINRFTEDSLVKEFEALCIGRPSTYAAIMQNIQYKGYVQKIKGAMIPTFTGYAVVQFLERYYTDLVNLQYTSKMEDDLDQISIGDNSIVGAQSLVVKNCENNSVYFGIPAKKIKNREDNSKYL